MNGSAVQVAYNLAALVTAVFLVTLIFWLFGGKKNARSNY